MKSRTKILLLVLATLVLAAIFCKSSIVSARNIGSYDDFWVEGHNTHRTSYLGKTKYSRYVVQADAPTDRSKINLRTWRNIE